MEPVDFDLDELFGPATAREEDNLQGTESNRGQFALRPGPGGPG